MQITRLMATPVCVQCFTSAEMVWCTESGLFVIVLSMRLSFPVAVAGGASHLYEYNVNSALLARLRVSGNQQGREAPWTGPEGGRE